MANFAYSEKASVTARVSYVDHVYEDEPGDFDSEFDFFKLTLAHGYAFTDNLFLVNEISYIDGYAYNGEDGTADSDFDSLIFAAELIFSF